MSDQSISSWIRQPASIILIIALVIMIVMMADQSQNQSGTEPVMVPPVKSSAPVMPSPGSMPAPVARPIGGEMPKIVQRLGGMPAAPAPTNAQPGQLTAPDLGSLLGRLEDKVKAEPENINNRLLLAQTYNELGLPDKAINEARTAIKQFPDHARAKLVLASILSKRKAEDDLNEAIAMLNELIPNSDVKQYLVYMYLGDAAIRKGDHQSAAENWKLALKGMPTSDNRRAKIEKGIADIAAGNAGG